MDAASERLSRVEKAPTGPVRKPLTPAQRPCYGDGVGGNRSEKRAGDDGGDSVLGEADAFGYRRPLPGFSTKAGTPSANDAAMKGFSGPPALTDGMDRMLSESDTRRLPDLGIAL